MSSQRQDQYPAGLDGESKLPSKYGAVDVGNKADLQLFMASKLQIIDGPANGKLPEGVGIVICYFRVVDRR